MKMKKKQEEEIVQKRGKQTSDFELWHYTTMERFCQTAVFKASPCLLFSF